MFNPLSKIWPSFFPVVVPDSLLSSFCCFRYLSHADQKQFIVATPFILLDRDHEDMANFYLEVLEKEAMKEVGGIFHICLSDNIR